MLANPSYKSKQFFIAIIKLSIIVGASYYIYNKLVQNEKLSFSQFVEFLSKNEVFSPKNVTFLLILTIFNWFFEILKWQKLVKTIKNISFFEALNQSLGGHTASLITPNRIGDYGAKVLYFAKQYRKRVVLLNLLGNSYQMLVTTSFGVIGLFLFNLYFDLDLNYRKGFRFLILVAVVGGLSLFGIQQSKFKIKGFSIERVVLFFKSLRIETHRTVFLCSALRYIIFSFQFYLLLLLFGVELDKFTALITISSMYFISSVVPSLAAFDVLIKASSAVFLFGILGVDELKILCVSLTMWLLNFVLPSIFGSYFVLNFKLPQDTE